MTETQECYAVIDAMKAIIRPMNDAIASQDWSEVIRHASELESYASSVVVWAEDLPTDLRPRMRSVALTCREKALTTRRQASALLECDVDEPTPLLATVWCLVAGLVLPIIILWGLRR